MTDHREPPVLDDIPLAAIRIDGGTQARTEIDEDIVAEYAEAISEGANMPPLVVFFDGANFWLADGFHRYHAYLQAGFEEGSAEIHTGLRDDAVLYAAGANASHGLRRTNTDKRNAVEMVLAIPKCAGWSNSAIAKACGVSDHFVGTVRKAHSDPIGVSQPAERTYTTKHGTQATMRTAKIGKTKPAATPTPPNSRELEPVEPMIATPRLPPEQGQVAVTEVEALRDEVAQLKGDVAELLVENEGLARVVEADEQLKAAWAEVTRHKALAENAERTLTARSHEFNERARNVIYWKNRAEKAEKKLAKTEATGESSALRTENAQLRTQLGELAEQFEETLAEAETMRKVIEADDRLAEAVKQLKQVQELNRVLETRLQGLVSEKSEILRRYNGVRHQLSRLKQDGA